MRNIIRQVDVMAAVQQSRNDEIDTTYAHRQIHEKGTESGREEENRNRHTSVNTASINSQIIERVSREKAKNGIRIANSLHNECTTAQCGDTHKQNTKSS